jgi:hypothetical protein
MMNHLLSFLQIPIVAATVLIRLILWAPGWRPVCRYPVVPVLLLQMMTTLHRSLVVVVVVVVVVTFLVLILVAVAIVMMICPRSPWPLYKTVKYPVTLPLLYFLILLLAHNRPIFLD